MVDISLQAVEGDSLPKDLYLSLRVGEQQKFSKANCSRTYKFPASSDRRYGKLELYRRVGVSSVSLDGEHFQGTHELAIQVEDERIQSKEVKYRFCLDGSGLPAPTSNETAPTQSDSNKQTSEKVVQAREYLQQHQLEQRLSEAMQAVLRERPEDPAAFIAQRLQSGAGVLKKVQEPIKVAEPPKADEPKKAEPTPMKPAPEAAAPAPSTAAPAPAAPAAAEPAPAKPAPAAPTPAALAPAAPTAAAAPAHVPAPPPPEPKAAQAPASKPAPAPAPSASPVQAAPAAAAQPAVKPEVGIQLPMPVLADYPLPDSSFADPISSATLMVGDGMCSFANIGRPAVMIF